MSPEKQRIAIAEACGWSEIEDRSERLMMAPGFSVVGYPPEHALIGKKQPIPDSPNDLNAMHEAWFILDAIQRAKFAEELAYVVLAVCNDPKTEFVFSRCSLSVFANATAAERAEAFLKTIGKWEDEDRPIIPAHPEKV